MSTRAAAGRAGLVAVAALLTLGVMFRAQLLSGFTQTFFNPYDGTIELSILEHWVRVLQGSEAWHTTGYFYPFRGTLAYNDGYLLFGLPYALARWLGASPYTGAELAHAAMWLAGFVGMVGFMRAAFGAGLGWALLAAATFTLGSAYTAHSIHAQLLSVCLAPVLGWTLARLALAATAGRGGAALGWGLAAAALLGAWLLTAFYMAWFTLFFALLLLPAWLLAADRDERRAAWRVLRVLGPGRIAVLGVALVVAAAPFLWLYLPKSAETAMHPFAAALAYLPRPTDALNVGPDNWLFGGLMTELHARLPEAFVTNGERLGGLSPPLLLAFLATCVWCWRAAPFRRRGLVRALCLATLAAWALALDYGAAEPWRLVFALVPGAKAVRVVARLQLFLAMPVVAVVAVGLAHAARRLPGPVAALAGVLVLLGQPAARGPLFDVALFRLQGADSVPAAPAGCAAFFTRDAQAPRGWDGNEHDALYSHNVDAMLIAELIGLPTINGFSTFNPPGWNFADPDRPDYLRRVWTYAQERKVPNLCALGLRNMTWDADPFREWRKRPDGVDGEAVSVAAGQRGVAWLGSGWSSPEPWGTWSDGPIATLVVGTGSSAATPMRLTVVAFGQPRRSSPSRRITVTVDDVDVATWIVGPDPATYSASLPAPRDPGAATVVRFRIEEPTSPIELGLGGDGRRLGFALKTVGIAPAPPP